MNFFNNMDQDQDEEIMNEPFGTVSQQAEA